MNRRLLRILRGPVFQYNVWDELERGISTLLDLSLEDLMLRRQKAVGTLDFTI